MAALAPHQLIIPQPSGASCFAIGIAAKTLIPFYPDCGRQFIVDRSRDGREQIRVAGVDTLDDGNDRVIAEVEGVDQIGPEDVIPIGAGRQIVVGFAITVIVDLLRKDVLVVPERVEVVERHREVIHVAPVHVAFHVHHRTVGIDGAADRCRWRIVSDDTGQVRQGQILEPGSRRSIGETGIRGADHVRMLAVATHELVAKERQVVRSRRQT